MLGATTWLILSKTSGNSELKEKAFAVDNASDISKVVLLDLDKNRIELTKANGVWIVNGKYPAREELIQSLFDVLTRVTIRSPLPKAAHDNVIRDMMGSNVKVDIYTGGKDKPVRTYYVGGPTTDKEGTYMLLEIDGKPVANPSITYLPGFKGYLSYRYNTDEENWRTKVLFGYKVGDIKSLSIEYPTKEEKSFTIRRLAIDSFELLPKDEKNKMNEGYQQKYIRQYLGFYSSISIESFDNSFSKKDSTIRTTPYCVISVTSNDNSMNKVKLFYMPISERSKQQYDEKGNEMTYDIDHFHAAINNDKDFAIAQYYVFGKLLRSYNDFFFRPSASPDRNP